MFEVFLILIVVGFLALELVLSFVVFPLRSGKNFYSFRMNDMVYQYHPKIGYVLKPRLNYSNPTRPQLKAPRKINFVDVRTNYDGFLTNLVLEDQKRNYQLIFCIGGSTTAGFESHHDKTYPAILDSLTEPKGYRCINVGVGGYRSIHELLLFKHKILDYHPSAIIVFSGFNDFESRGYNVSRPYNPFQHYLSDQLPKNSFESLLFLSSLFYLVRSKYFIGHKQKIAQEARFADFISNATKAVQEDHEWLDEWKTNITSLINLCKERKIKFYLIGQLTPIYLNAPEEVKEYANEDLGLNGQFEVFAQFHHLLRQESIALCDKNSVTFLDISAYFEKLCSQYLEKEYYKHRFSWFVDRAHLTENGNALIAKYIYGRILEDL